MGAFTALIMRDTRPARTRIEAAGARFAAAKDQQSRDHTAAEERRLCDLEWENDQLAGELRVKTKQVEELSFAVDRLRRKMAHEVADAAVPPGSITAIKRVVADYYRVARADLISARRTRRVVRPRQIAMWLCRHYTPHALPEIGRHFGQRDHTTVLHAVRKVDQIIQIEGARWRGDIDALKVLVVVEFERMEARRIRFDAERRATCAT